MFLGLPEASYLLILIGAFGALMANAALRRDPASMLAMGLPLLFCAARSDVPGWLVAWGCAIYAAALILFVLLRLVSAMGLPGSAVLAGAAAVLGLSAGAADASHIDFAASSLHHPPAIGVRLQGMLRDLARDRAD